MSWFSWRSLVLLLPFGSTGSTTSQYDEEERTRRRDELLATLQQYSQLALRVGMRVAQFLLGFIVLFGVASLLYAVLYYMMIPSRILEQQVFFDYGNHAALSHNSMLPLTLPSANLNLLEPTRQWKCFDADQGARSSSSSSSAKPKHMLDPGMKYDLYVELHMPRSRVNVELGMFMLDTTLSSWQGQFLASSSRPLIVPSTPKLVEWTQQVIYLIPWLLDLTDSSHLLHVRVINGFDESRDLPLTNVTLKLNHPALQVYEAKLTVIAQLSGVKYLMYHWTFSTALLVILNMVFVEGVGLLILYAFYSLPPLDDSQESGDVDTPPNSTSHTQDSVHSDASSNAGGLPMLSSPRELQQVMDPPDHEQQGQEEQQITSYPTSASSASSTASSQMRYRTTRGALSTATKLPML